MRALRPILLSLALTLGFGSAQASASLAPSAPWTDNGSLFAYGPQAPYRLYSPIDQRALRKAGRQERWQEARQRRAERKERAERRAQRKKEQERRRKLDAGSLATARATAHVKPVDPKRVTEGQFEATAYGPPWDCATCMEGTGITATGTRLGENPGPYKKLYIVATDPSVIPTGAWVYVWPNPFGYRGAFKADDVGGAIKGRKLDFYDWRGRKTQNDWGRRQVTVTAAKGPGLGAGDSKLGRLAYRYVKQQSRLLELTGQITDQRELIAAAQEERREAQRKAQVTQERLDEMTDRLLKAQDELDRQTRLYLRLTRGVSISPDAQASGSTDELLRYAADSDDQDAVLVWAAASHLMNRKTKMLGDLQAASARLKVLQSRSLVLHRQRERQVQKARRAEQRLQGAKEKLQKALSRNRKASRKLEADLKKMGVGDGKGPIELTDLLVDPRFSPPDAARLLGNLTLAQRLVLLARREYDKGVRETPDGSNESPDIARYRTAVALSWPNTAWCAYFTSYIARRAGAPMGYKGEGFAAVAAARAWAQQEGTYFPSTGSRSPKAGDIVFWPEHIGLVVSVKGQTITTIEGNSSNRVSLNTHSRGSVMGFARLKDPK